MPPLNFGEEALYSLFWSSLIALCFSLGYGLRIGDRGREGISIARLVFTAMIGILIMLGTYGHTLQAKPFVLRDCLLLAFIAGHGWQAEALVRGFLSRVTVRTKSS